MRIELQVAGILPTHYTELPDDSHVAALLRQESCAAVTIERDSGTTYRYSKPAK